MDYSGWVERPAGIWDLRPEGRRDPQAVCPGVACRVVNAQNERISWVFYVNFATGLVGRWRSYVNEQGIEVTKFRVHSDGRREMEEEWIVVPGVKVLPLGVQELKTLTEEVEARKKHRFRARADGSVEKI